MRWWAGRRTLRVALRKKLGDRRSGGFALPGGMVGRRAGRQPHHGEPAGRRITRSATAAQPVLSEQPALSQSDLSALGRGARSRFVGRGRTRSQPTAPYRPRSRIFAEDGGAGPALGALRRRCPLDDYCREQGESLRQFANFCALSEQFRTGWRCWPADYRDPGSPQVEHFAAEHAAGCGSINGCSGWSMSSWRAARSRSHYADCPWASIPMERMPGPGRMWWPKESLSARRPILRAVVRIGACRLDPASAPRRGLQPFIQTIRATLRHAGALRVDHVMGLFRLFWIPRGASRRRGSLRALSCR